MNGASSEVAELDDFPVIAERRQVSETIATLIDRYSKLNEEMARRATLRRVRRRFPACPSRSRG